jgi:hypothetical protein
VSQHTAPDSSACGRLSPRPPAPSFAASDNEVAVACSKKKKTEPQPGGYRCRKCGVGAKKKKKLCKPERVD